MHLKSLTNEELDQNLRAWVKTEKKALHQVLFHVAEVDRRKMYLDYAYSSLRAYLENRMGYDGGSAQRRIDAVRLSHSVPSVIESLHEGELKLSQVTILQKTFREVKDKPISKEIKSEIIEAIKNKSVHDTQSIVSKALNIEIKQQPKITPQADESVRFEISLNKPQWEKLNTMRELLSHSIPSGNWSEVLEYLSDKVIQQKLGKEPASAHRIQKKSEKEGASQKPQTTPTAALNSPSTLSEPQNFKPAHNEKQESKERSFFQLKKKTLKQGRCCQFKNKEGKMCGSRWNLQIDHVQPKWAEGKDTPENLRVLCGNHNRYLYRKQANIRIV